MTGYSAISDVGKTLVTLLEEEMSGLLDTDEIALASPAVIGKGDKVRLSLFLYAVTENPHRKNQRRQEVDTTTLAGEPLELDLHYALTAYPSEEKKPDTKTTADQHTVLGRAMQAFSDAGIVRGSTLEGSLTDEVAIAVEADATSRVMNVWNTFQDRPYWPSVAYVVGPVTIESADEETVPRIVELDSSADQEGDGGG